MDKHFHYLMNTYDYESKLFAIDPRLKNLRDYKEPIINSFVMVQKHGAGGLYNSRLSNGPIESLNRKIKDLKRLGRGFLNFEHFRNRFLYATRDNPTLDGTTNHTQVKYYEEDNDENI